MDQEKIRVEAKKILDNFAKSLDKVTIPKSKSGKKTVSGFREERPPTKTDPEFKKQMFKNAPNKEDNKYILAEKKNW